MDKITLVITSRNPNEYKLNRLLKSAKGFDEVLVHIDEVGITRYDSSMNKIGEYFLKEHYDIPSGYNLLMTFVDTEWVCTFCDDDYFEEDGLLKMLTAIRIGDANDCDVCTFRTFVTGYAPWRDKGSVLVEAINRWVAPFLMRKGVEVKARRWYGYPGIVNAETMKRDSYTPAGSFFRKSAWDKVGGMTGSIAHDWILWFKMIRSGFRFKYFPYIVYTYERRENSAWFRQFKEIAGGSMAKLRRIVDKEATI